MRSLIKTFFLLILFVAVGCQNSVLPSAPKSTLNKRTQAELVSTFPSYTMGPCHEKVGDVFYRNSGKERCRVLESKYSNGVCTQMLACEPIGELLGPSGSPLGPNTVCEIIYTPGQPHKCQEQIAKDFDSCEDEYQKAIQSGVPIEQAESKYQACMKQAKKKYDDCIQADFSEPHFDCDDYVLVYPTQYPDEDPEGFYGLGCNGHAMSVVRQGPGENGMCWYAVVEPQATDGENVILFFFQAECEGIPAPPPEILNQRGWRDCVTWLGDVHDPYGGEPPYTSYPPPPRRPRPSTNPTPSPGPSPTPGVSPVPSPIPEVAPPPEGWVPVTRSSSGSR